MAEKHQPGGLCPDSGQAAPNHFNHLGFVFSGNWFALCVAGTRNKMRFQSSIAFSIGILAITGVAVAQDQTPHPWRSVNDPPPAGVAADQAPAPPASPDQAQSQGFPTDPQNAATLPPPADQQQGAPPPAQTNAPPPAQPGLQPPANYGQYYPPNYAPQPNVPAQLTIRQGTYAIVRINQWLSSDRNQPGDTFTATLEQPLVVNGLVVAPRGATVVGRVTEARKAGRVEGTSRLGVQITELTLADGQQIPVQTQMISRNGPTSQGRDAAAIGGTTALGAAIGAGVDWGRGAAIGAGAGAAAGIIGVLLTRGHPTVIYPESVLTFQLTAPATFATDRAPLAFQYVTPQDYAQQPGPNLSQRGPGVPPPPAAYGYYPPYGYPYPYAYPYYPYYAGVGVYVGPRYGYWGYRRWR